MTSDMEQTVITVSALSGRLGEILRDVEQGTTFTVTRYGRPIAVLGPAAQSSSSSDNAGSMTREDSAGYAHDVSIESGGSPDTALVRLMGSSSTRAAMAVFLRDPASSFYQREIARKVGIGLRSAQIALERLEGLGLVTSERDGNRRYYKAVRTERFEDLRTLLSRELGIAEVIARQLTGLNESVDWAFVFGSAASGTDTMSSDIDLLVIGDVTDDALVGPIADAQRELGRDIDVVRYRAGDFAKKREQGNHFVRSVLAQPRLDVIGGSDDT